MLGVGAGGWLEGGGDVDRTPSLSDSVKGDASLHRPMYLLTQYFASVFFYSFNCQCQLLCDVEWFWDISCRLGSNVSTQYSDMREGRKFRGLT